MVASLYLGIVVWLDGFTTLEAALIAIEQEMH